VNVVNFAGYSEAVRNAASRNTVTRIVPMPPDERYLKQFQ